MEPYFKDEHVTIYHGDCRQVLPFLGRFDLLLTDPPYGISFAAQPTKWQRRDGKKPEDWDNDSAPDWLMGMIREKADKLIVWGGNYYRLPPSRGWLAWRKPDAPPSMATIELAWTSMDMNSKMIDCSISATNHERIGHPTQKPLAVIKWALSLAGDVQTILDPFAGSGTTGRAAKDMGKQAVLIEREERYCEIAAKRMCQQVLDLSA